MAAKKRRRKRKKKIEASKKLAYWAASVATLSAASSLLLSAFGRDPVGELTGTIFTACVGYLITYAGKSLGEKISRNRHRLDADGNPLPDPSGDTLNNEEAKDEHHRHHTIANAALALIGAGVSVFLIPWLKKQTTEAQRKELTAWVKIGVAAAEQLYVGQGRGEEKKQYVLDFLKQKGFKVDEESVVNAIEAIVKQLNTEGLTIE